MSKRYIQNCTGGACGDSKHKESNRIVMRIIFYILTILFASVVVYLLFFSAQMKVNTITITGTQELDSGEIQQKIQESLQGNHLKFIPKNNFLFISQRGIEKQIKDEYKKIRSVTIVKKFPDTVNIEIDERKGLLVWCRNAESCFLLDENGIAYSAADFNSPELTQNNLLQINDNSAAEVLLGDKIIADDYEKYLLAIADLLKNIGVEIEGQYSTPSRMSQEIQVRSMKGFTLNFSTQFELDSALKTLAVILKKEIPEDIQGNLAYIDLRSENKVFYKLNTAPEPTETENVEEKKEEDKKVDNKKSSSVEKE